MLSGELHIVPIDSIPSPPYTTPVDNIPLMYAVSKKMEVLCVARGGEGLAAAQVGLPWRMFVVKSGDEFKCYFDCTYEPMDIPVVESKYLSVEGCLSIPGLFYVVKRHANIKVSGMRLLEGPEGAVVEPFESSFSGGMSVLMQHEIDHDMGRERMIDVIGDLVRPV